MNAHSELIDLIHQAPHDSQLRLQLADLLIADGDPHGQVMRWQCELEQMSCRDAGWYSRYYRLGNLLRGTNPFLSLQLGDSVESKLTSQLSAIKVDGKNVGSSFVRRGFVEVYSVFDVARLKSCEPAVIEAAPLINSLEFSELTTTEQFNDLISLKLLGQATELTLKKCKFSASDLQLLFSAPSLAGLKALKLLDCKFESGVASLASLLIAAHLQRLTIGISKDDAAEVNSKSYLGDLLTGDHFPALRSLEFDYACTAIDLQNLQSWSGLSQLKEFEVRGWEWPAETWRQFLQNDLSGLQSLTLSGVSGDLGPVDLAHCPALRALIFKGLKLDATSMKTLSETITSSVEQIVLVNCQLTSSAVSAWLTGKPLPHLKYLSLQNNQLDSTVLNELATTPWLTQLVALKLSFNPLGDDCGVVLANSSVFQNLVFLDLCETGLGDESARAIFNAQRFQSLEWLNLDGNAITGQSLDALLSSNNLNNIVALRLKSNELWDEHKTECIERFGKETVDSYFLGYLI